MGDFIRTGEVLLHGPTLSSREFWLWTKFERLAPPRILMVDPMRTAIAEKYDDLVSLAYLGIDESKPWLGFVECLTEAVGLRDASITISALNNHDGGLVITSDRAPHLTRDYFHQVLATDFMRIFNEMEISRPSSVDDLVPRRRWLASDLYKQYLKPFNIQRVLLTDVWRDPLLLVRLCVERSNDQEEFSEEDRQLLERLARHLAKSMDLRSSLQQSHTSSQFYQDAMDQLGVCALFLNASGQLIHANQTGTDLLNQRNGLMLRDDKPVALSQCRNADHFHTLVGGLLGSDSPVPQGMCLLDHRGNMQLEILGRRLPLKGPAESKTAVAVLLITPSRLESKEPSTHLLRDIYGFTACEARLAKLLVQGYSTQEAADLLQVSINTVKTHLKGIFDKMGYNKQSQVLIALGNSALKFV